VDSEGWHTKIRRHVVLDLLPKTPKPQEVIKIIKQLLILSNNMSTTGITPPQSNVSSEKLVGSLLQLITNAQVRYEGTLVEIDRTERSMNLKNVRSYGTEGRRCGVGEVPP
jgi:hypothetical protein